MENNNKASEHAYKALMGSIFGTAKPVDENPITAQHRTEWLHEHFTNDEIWELFDTLKWQQELKD
jgi:phosphoglycerate-specific signal transduction histidine kinase